MRRFAWLAFAPPRRYASACSLSRIHRTRILVRAARVVRASRGGLERNALVPAIFCIVRRSCLEWKRPAQRPRSVVSTEWAHTHGTFESGDGVSRKRRSQEVFETKAPAPP